MQKRDSKGLALIGVGVGLIAFVGLPRLVTSDTIDWGLYYCLKSIAGCWQAYLIGGMGSIVVWQVAQGWPGLPRLAIRSLSLAATITPGFFVGHGFAIAPAIWVAIVYLLNGQLDRAFAWGVKPLLIVWFVIATVIFFLVDLRPKETEPAVK